MDTFFKSQKYLRLAKEQASKSGYNPNKLSLATNGVHKLTYETPDGKKVNFGRLGHSDNIYNQIFQPDIAEQKRNRFQKSHGAISKKYGLGKYSANELALKINW
jgi:hypothetical protein